MELFILSTFALQLEYCSVFCGGGTCPLDTRKFLLSDDNEHPAACNDHRHHHRFKFIYFAAFLL